MRQGPSIEEYVDDVYVVYNVYNVYNVYDVYILSNRATGGADEWAAG